jgi:hypothetical protein
MLNLVVHEPVSVPPNMLSPGGALLGEKAHRSANDFSRRIRDRANGKTPGSLPGGWLG